MKDVVGCISEDMNYEKIWTVPSGCTRSEQIEKESQWSNWLTQVHLKMAIKIVCVCVCVCVCVNEN